MSPYSLMPKFALTFAFVAIELRWHCQKMGVTTRQTSSKLLKSGDFQMNISSSKRLSPVFLWGGVLSFACYTKVQQFLDIV